MFFAAIGCTAQAASHKGTAIYARMLVSVLTTYAVYFLSSLLWFDPFHIVTSFLQYALMSAT